MIKNTQLILFSLISIFLVSCGDNRIDGHGFEDNSTIKYDNSFNFQANMNESLVSDFNFCDEMIESNSSNLNIINSEISYQPSLNYVGLDKIAVKCKFENKIRNYLLKFDVKEKNHAPTSSDQVLNVNEDDNIDFNFSYNDIDENVNNIEIVTSPFNGTLTGNFPNYNYEPNSNFSGSDYLEFKIIDSKGSESSIHRLDINVIGINDTPSSQNNTYTFIEDSINNAITLYGNDIEGDLLTYNIDSSPTNGTLNCTNENCTYTPDSDYNGTDSFTYTVSDGSSSSSAVININITSVNDAPSSSDLSLTTDEDTPINFSLIGNDVDSTLTYTTSNPANGVLSCINENCTYTPNSNYNGTDSFTYTVSDGEFSSSSNVTITVNPISDIPVSNDLSLTTNEDTDLNFNLNATDNDGDILTYIIVSNPANGTLNCTADACLYSPNTNYNGTDSFTYKVNDGTSDSNTATGTINVVSINDVPISNDNTYSFLKNSTDNSIILTASDVENSTLNYSIVSNVSNGTLNCTNENCLYTPNNDYVGTDSFTFKANDGEDDSNVSSITITIVEPNSQPTADNQTLSFLEDSLNNSITLTGNDPDGDTLTYTIISSTTNGTLNCTNENCTYTPNSNYVGSDSFTFKVNDGTLDSSTATISIDVTAVNDAPIAQDLNLNTNEDTDLNFNLLGTDVDGDTLTYTIISSTTNGTLNCTVDACVYSPNANYVGSDSFTYKVNDGTIDSNIATGTITVSSINDTPVTSNDSVSTNEDTSFDLSSILISNSSDIDGDSLNYEIVSFPSNGTISGTHPNLVYTPYLDFNGTDTLSYRVHDGTSFSNTSTITVNVLPVNDNPVSSNLMLTTDEDTSVNFNLTCSDVDGDTLTYTVVSNPSNGVLNCTNESCSYTPNLNYNGNDLFSFKCNDGTVDSSNYDVLISVNSINDVPTSSDNTYTLTENSFKDFTISNNDADGDSLSLIIETNPSNGVISGTFPNLTYTPNNNFYGLDSFTYKLNDGTEDSISYTIDFIVQEKLGDGLNAFYFNYTGTEQVYLGKEIVSNINFNWGETEPFSGTGTSYYGIRYEGYIKAKYSELYTIYTNSDDGVRVWIDGNLIIDNWTTHALTEDSANINLVEGQMYHIVVDYFEMTGDNEISLSWESPSQVKEIIPQSKLFSTEQKESSLRDHFSGLTLNKYNISSDQNEFPLLIDLSHLNSDNHFWDNVQSDGEDIVVTVNNLTNRVPLEIASFDRINKRGELWIKVDLSTLMMGKIYIHYNDSTTSNISKDLNNSTYGSQNVWSNGYVFVGHMNESGGDLKDSTDGSELERVGDPLYERVTENNALTSALGFNYDASTPDSFVERVNTSKYNFSNEITMQSWVYIEQEDHHAYVMRKRNSGDKHGSYTLMFEDSNPRVIIGNYWGKTELSCDNDIIPNTWNQITTVFNSADGSVSFYINGNFINTEYTSRIPLNENMPFDIGGDEFDNNDHIFFGRIDEARLSNKIRSSSWISTEYNMTKNISKWYFYLELN